MSNAIKSYATIHNNPFILAPLFESFFSELPKKPRNILLSYFVLPVVLYPPSRSFLTNANAKSSIRTMSRSRERFYGVWERLEQYRALSNLCLQYAVDSNSIKIEDDLSVLFVSSNLDSSLCPESSVKAARRLANIFALYEIVAVYRYFGVKAL